MDRISRHQVDARQNSNFDTMSTPISFELAQTNEGNAMDLTSGIFTAPKTGTYFFSFTGMASFPATSSSSEVYCIIYKLVFIWTGVLSGRLGLKTQTPTIINGVHCRPCSRSWTWIRVIKSGWRLLTYHQGRIWLTVHGTPPISRVSCCWRKLWHPFNF